MGGREKKRTFRFSNWFTLEVSFFLFFFVPFMRDVPLFYIVLFFIYENDFLYFICFCGSEEAVIFLHAQNTQYITQKKYAYFPQIFISFIPPPWHYCLLLTVRDKEFCLQVKSWDPVLNQRWILKINYWRSMNYDEFTSDIAKRDENAASSIVFVLLFICTLLDWRLAGKSRYFVAFFVC